MKKLLNYEQKKMAFDIDTALSIKGIAILMMLWHHLFFREEIVHSLEVDFTPFPEYNMVSIAKTFKICVSLFTFVSGYGLWNAYNNSAKTGIRWVCERVVKLLSGFWFVYVITYIVTYCIDRRPIKIYFSQNLYQGIMNVLLDFCGLSQLFGTETLLTEWWYLSAALIFIFFIPILARVRNFSLVMIGIICLPRILEIEFLGGMSPYSFLTAFVLGCITKEYNVVEVWLQWGKKSWRFIVGILLMILGYKAYSKIPLEIFWELQWGILPFIVILFSVEFITYIPVLRKMLIFMGKYSANIYLTHNIIRSYLKDFIYHRNFIYSYMLLCSMSLILAVVIEKLKQIFRYDVGIKKMMSFIDHKVVLIMGGRQ